MTTTAAPADEPEKEKKSDDPASAMERIADGASKGGKSRAKRLSADRRAEIARNAAMSRWAGEGHEPPVLAKYGAADRPVRIGSTEIPCYVLADGRRVLVQRGIQSGIGMSTSGGSMGAHRLALLVESFGAKGLDVNDLAVRMRNPIRFMPTGGGKPAYGYEATILPELCHLVVEADRRGLLGTAQKRYADQCSVLLGFFAKVAIIALVDEATGYQVDRPRDALALILRKFIAKELQPWVRTFPSEFYKQLYRLSGWTFSEDSNARPGVIGHWTNNIVYKRLAPGVLAELKRLTPRDEKGRLKDRLFQRLTGDIGHPKLREHLAGVTMLLKYAPDWDAAWDRLDTDYPQYGDTPLLPFPDDFSPPSLPTGGLA